MTPWVKVHVPSKKTYIYAKKPIKRDLHICKEAHQKRPTYMQRSLSKETYIYAKKPITEADITMPRKKTMHMRDMISWYVTRLISLWYAPKKIRMRRCVTIHHGMWQRVAVCCSVLQCVAVRCSVLQCAALCVAVWCSVCCSVLQCVTAQRSRPSHAKTIHRRSRSSINNFDCHRILVPITHLPCSASFSGTKTTSEILLFAIRYSRVPPWAACPLLM